MLRFYESFEVDDHSGAALSEQELAAAHCSRIQHLQRVAFRLFPEELRSLALANIAAVEKRSALLEYLRPLSKDQILLLAARLNLVAEVRPPPHLFPLLADD